jgi:type IV secretion system protein VirB3
MCHYPSINGARLPLPAIRRLQEAVMSEEEGGQLEVDKLFKGLTRPAMIFGVSFPFCFINLIVSFMSYVLSDNLLVLLVIMPAIHAVGYIICFKEPLFMELFMVKAQKCSKCTNKLYHGSNSYDVN